MPVALKHPLRLFRITGPRFCAGILVDISGRIVKCAPYLRRMLYKESLSYAEALCRASGWSIEEEP